MELKLRGLPVSGTKTDLIERLKLYQESSTNQPATAMEVIAPNGTPQSESMNLTPPVSPISSETSGLGTEEGGMVNGQAKGPDALSPAHTAPSWNSPYRAPHEDSPMETRTSKKDQRLHEKERQIEELMRKLEQEQRLVEELKMQLEEEKKSQHGGSPPQPSPPAPIQVKEETRAPSNFSGSCSSPTLPTVVKQEEAPAQSQSDPLHQFLISHQQVPQAIKQPHTGSQILLPVSLPASAANIQLPNNGIKLQSAVSSAVPGHIQTPGLMPQKIEASAALQQQCTTHTKPMTQVKKNIAYTVLL